MEWRVKEGDKIPYFLDGVETKKPRKLGDRNPHERKKHVKGLNVIRENSAVEKKWIEMYPTLCGGK